MKARPHVFRRLFPLAILVLASIVEAAPVILDDFSTDKLTENYTLMNGSGVTANVADGLLQLSSFGDYSGYIWNSNSLNNVGDSVSIDFDLVSGLNAGLTLWKSNVPVVGLVDLYAKRLVELRYHYQSNQLDDDVHTILLDGTPSGFSTLSATILDRTESTTVLEFMLSGTGFTTVTDALTFNYTGPIYFGPALYQATAQYDNLTFTAGAIPEPAIYGWIAGFAALFAAAACKRASGGSGKR